MCIRRESSNTNVKDSAVKELNSIIRKLDKGKYSKDFELANIKPIIKDLREHSVALDNAIGTGKEHTENISVATRAKIKTLANTLNQQFFNRFKEAAGEVIGLIDDWKDLINGDVSDDIDGENAEESVNRKTKALKGKLAEFDIIKDKFGKSAQTLEKEISGLESDKEELDNLLMNELNERKQMDHYLRKETTESKIGTLKENQASYSSCYNLLDAIYTHISEMIRVGSFTSGALERAKAFLRIEDLRNVLEDPKKAMSILQQMQNNLDKISAQSKAIDTSIRGTINSGADATVDTAMKEYREKLLLEKGLKNATKVDIAKDLDELKRSQDTSNDVTASNNKKEERI